MLEFCKTATATAKKNGLEKINNKIIADFSIIKKAVEDCKTDIDNINSLFISTNTIYDSIVKELKAYFNKNQFTSLEFMFSRVVFHDTTFSFDVINKREAVYVNGIRKYGIVTPEAIRLTVRKNDNIILNTSINEEKFLQNYFPIFHIDIENKN